MDHYRDERIVCVGCGDSFLFSAAEAAHYAERGLAAPPKRCRECRRARKEQRDQGAPQRPGNGRFGPQGNTRGEPRPRMPLDTGDVNEYRSPMQDGFRPAAHSGVGFSMRGRPRGRPFGNSDGNYRAPAFQDRVDRVDSPRQPGGGGRGRPRGAGAPRPASAMAADPPRPARSEPRTRPMFSITCKSCGAESQVPFKPDEGRDVFCQACYRARKPS